jgi:hypothetical protein
MIVRDRLDAKPIVWVKYDELELDGAWKKKGRESTVSTFA